MEFGSSDLWGPGKALILRPLQPPKKEPFKLYTYDLNDLALEEPVTRCNEPVVEQDGVLRCLSYELFLVARAWAIFFYGKSRR